MLCSGGKKTDSCKGKSSSILIKGLKKFTLGDSGSPLLQYDSKSRFTIAGLVLTFDFMDIFNIFDCFVTGIVSFGPSVCGGGVPGVFTRVQSFLPWIKKVLEREL